MNRLILLLLPLLFLMPPSPVHASPEVSAEHAQAEFALLERALLALHPAVDRYQSREALHSRIADAQQEVAAGASRLQMFTLVSRIAASVQCGHTWTNPLNQRDDVQAALAALPALPLRVRWLEDGVVVLASADASVSKNDALISIDGIPVATLADTLLPYLRADAGEIGKRRSQLDSTWDGGALDRYLPLLHPPRDGKYLLVLRSPSGTLRTVSVRGRTVAERDALLAAAHAPDETQTWRLDIADGVATLTLPTFSFWRTDFDWQGFLDDAFRTFRERHVSRLVIDLRQNEGGDDAIGEALLSHLLHAPYTVRAGRAESAYERVPYRLARYLDTWDFDFFDRTDRVVRRPGHAWLLREQSMDRVITPAAEPFAGHVALLTAPRMSSAGFLFARNAHDSGAARLVGQRTGGNRRGLNGGELAWLTLPYSGVAVDIPLIATVHEHQPDGGVDPHQRVSTRVADVIAGRDPDREAALAWFAERGASSVEPD